MTAMARLTGVDKELGGRPILSGVSLTVEAGEWVALVGRSGSGKSTLLHLLGGLDRRYRGAVEVAGHDLARLEDDALARLRNREVGFVFQSFHLLEHLSVRENVALPSLFGGARLAPKEVAERVERALERVGMAEFAAASPARLSGGQKQRVAIARALFSAPKLLLADEPTGNLDAETGRAIVELFGALHREGLTLLLVTHEERVSRAASRVLRLDAGRLVAAQGVEA
jgi:putative ABC transport system ATP-binding protein